MEKIQTILDEKEVILWEGRSEKKKSNEIFRFIIKDIFTGIIVILTSYLGPPYIFFVIVVSILWLFLAIPHFFKYMYTIINVRHSYYAITSQRIIERRKHIFINNDYEPPREHLDVKDNFIIITIEELEKFTIVLEENGWTYSFYLENEKNSKPYIKFIQIKDYLNIKKILTNLSPFRSDVKKKGDKVKEVIFVGQ